jgi:conjugal transfer pilus assembly protein TraK
VVVPLITATVQPIRALAQTNNPQVNNPQVVQIGANQTAQATVSLRELTRIVIEGERIASVDYRDGAVDVQRDRNLGEIRILPPANDASPINLFLTSESKRTYSLLLSVSDVPSQTILVRDTTPKKKVEASGAKVMRSNEHDKNIRNLIVAMSKNLTPSDMDVRMVNTEFALWAEAKFVLRAVYLGREYVGNHFKVTNTSNAMMRLEEQEFYKQGVHAVAIVQLELPPQASTSVFIVRERGENE